MTLAEYDKQQGVCMLCGVDEAGRGPLAGDVYAAAVVLPENCTIEGIDDSKKLSAKKREELFIAIKNEAISYNIGIATVKEIDELNILNATMLAMQRAVEGLSVTPKLVLVDGNKNPKLSVHSRCVIKGDSISLSIAAASIIAKVARDHYMEEISLKYPQYQFDKHKGYGTKIHYEMLDIHGISDVHRQTFLKKYKEKSPNKTKLDGNKGEDSAVAYLKKQGYEIVERNYGTKNGEIDVIAKKDSYIAFVEVKTRGADTPYSPREAVNSAKQKKIIKAAQEYIQTHDTKDLQPRFDICEIYLKPPKEKNAINAVKQLVFKEYSIKELNYFENAFGVEDK